MVGVVVEVGVEAEGVDTGAVVMEEVMGAVVMEEETMEVTEEGEGEEDVLIILPLEMVTGIAQTKGELIK